MAIENKVTKCYPPSGTPLSEEFIQAHIDEQNAAGYHLIGVDNLNGWYRFFWAKVTE